MILKADFRCKQVTPEADDCVVEKVVELPTVEYDRFCRSMLERYPFIGEVAASLHYNDGMRHGFLVLGVGRNDGILVDPQGADYARYSAFIPNARSLLTPDMAIDRSYISPAEPWRDESRDEMLRMTLHVDGKPDYTLVLPADEKYLDAVKAYLDIDVFADAMLRDIRFKVPYIGELICDTDCPSVEDYNEFAEALEGIWQKDGMLLTYAAILDAERPDTLHRARELLQELDNYQRIVDTYGYGQQRLQERLGLDDESIAELEGYMDFERYGSDCMEHDGVVETEFGRLRRLEPPFPEQAQEQHMLPPHHRARNLASSALESSDQATASAMSTALAQMNTFMDIALEQVICFDSNIDAEKFAKEKTAIFLVLPEEDRTKNFMAGLMIQNLSKELFELAEKGKGRLPNRVVFFCDEFGTMPAFDVEALFSAGRSRGITLVPIIQSLAQLEKNYGREGAEILTDNTRANDNGLIVP